MYIFGGQKLYGLSSFTFSDDLWIVTPFQDTQVAQTSYLCPISLPGRQCDLPATVKSQCGASELFPSEIARLQFSAFPDSFALGEPIDIEEPCTLAFQGHTVDCGGHVCFSVDVRSSSVTFKDVTFRNGSAVNGGGISIFASAVQLKDVAFEDCTCSQNGILHNTAVQMWMSIVPQYTLCIYTFGAVGLDQNMLFDPQMRRRHSIASHNHN
jgi:hypothetical protein